MKGIFTGGGTGGHIFPSLAVAQRYSLIPESSVIYVGSASGMESAIVPEAGFPFIGIQVRGFQGKNLLYNVKSLWILYKGVRELKTIFQRERPDFVFATGGYVSAPVVLAARLLRVPVFLHEQNQIPGLANRWLSYFASRVFVTFPDSIKRFPNPDKCLWSGLPLRQSFFQVKREEACQRLGLDPQKKTLLVTGGSRGASALNKIAESLYQWIEQAGWQMIHITGEGAYEEIIKRKDKMPGNESVKIFPFLSGMEDALAASHICLSRAGASFLSEMMFMGRPGILIPYPHATHNHQVENSRSLVEMGAAKMIEEKELLDDPGKVQRLLQELFDQPGLIEQMAVAARGFYREDPAGVIVDTIQKEIR